MILTTTDGQKDLPRYFATAFGIAQKGQNGRIDFVLDDGRTFRALKDRAWVLFAKFGSIIVVFLNGC